jgi:hypothetical protein
MAVVAGLLVKKSFSPLAVLICHCKAIDQKGTLLLFPSYWHFSLKFSGLGKNCSKSTREHGDSAANARASQS